MKIYSVLLLGGLFCLQSVPAQEEQGATNMPLSSLTVSAERSLQMRIEFLLNVAQAYAQEKNYTAAIDAYKRILELDPDYLEAKHNLSIVYLSLKQYDEATAKILELIDARPDDYTLLNNLAWIYATAEDPLVRNGKKAIDYAQQAMVMGPNDYHVWSTLAEAYYISGDYERAHRAIMHMSVLITRYGRDLTEQSVADYNEQIRKCQRAVDTANALEEAQATDPLTEAE